MLIRNSRAHTKNTTIVILADNSRAHTKNTTTVILADNSRAHAKNPTIVILADNSRAHAKNPTIVILADNCRAHAKNPTIVIHADNSRAHAKNLAISHKNAGEVLPNLLGQGITDFVVNESCNAYNECDLFLGYGKPVLNVEYASTPFSRSCTKYKTRMATIQRDQNLVAKGKSGYVYKTCL